MSSPLSLKPCNSPRPNVRAASPTTERLPALAPNRLSRYPFGYVSNWIRRRGTSGAQRATSDRRPSRERPEPGGTCPAEPDVATNGLGLRAWPEIADPGYRGPATSRGGVRALPPSTGDLRRTRH